MMDRARKMNILATLRDIRDGLRSGKYVHVKPDYNKLRFRYVSTGGLVPKKETRRLFNMRFINERYECQTACCIGGWLQRLSGIDHQDAIEAYPVLHGLFFPIQAGKKSRTPYNAGPRAAATAIDRALKAISERRRNVDPWARQ